jgi:hypothetical protein
MKTFDEDFYFLLNKLKNKDKFSFSKYADGEFAILVNRGITSSTEKPGENWTYNPNIDSIYRDELLSSFKFNQEGYYVGISCPCCVPMEHVKWMRDNVGVDKEHLTWANIFVNGNYEKFLNNFVPEFMNHDIIMVANKNANINSLPFKVEEHIPIGYMAMRENFKLVEELPKRDYKNKLILFCAGPLGNMLAAKMWKSNKNNIYLDIGSTLNPWLVGLNRDYLKGSPDLKKICIW